MNLFEYEGKQMMNLFHIPVPESHLLVTAEEPAPMDYPFVLKAQVMTGGRGKAGGVKVCRDDKDERQGTVENQDQSHGAPRRKRVPEFICGLSALL